MSAIKGQKTGLENPARRGVFADGLSRIAGAFQAVTSDAVTKTEAPVAAQSPKTAPVAKPKAKAAGIDRRAALGVIGKGLAGTLTFLIAMRAKDAFAGLLPRFFPDSKGSSPSPSPQMIKAAVAHYPPNPVTGRPFVIEAVTNGQEELVVAPGPQGKIIVHIRRATEKHAIDGMKPPVRAAAVQTFIQDKGRTVPLTLNYVTRGDRLELQPGRVAGLQYDGTTTDFLPMTECVRNAVSYAANRSATLIDQPVAERLGPDKGVAYIKTPTTETRMEVNGTNASVSARYYSPAFPKEGFAFRVNVPMTGRFETSQAVRSVYEGLKHILPVHFNTSSLDPQRDAEKAVHNVAAALVLDVIYNRMNKCKLAYMGTGPASGNRMAKDMVEYHIAPEDQGAFNAIHHNPDEINRVLNILPPYRDPSAKAAPAAKERPAPAQPQARQEQKPQQTRQASPASKPTEAAPPPRAPGAWNITPGIKNGKITTNPGLNF